MLLRMVPATVCSSWPALTDWVVDGVLGLVTTPGRTLGTWVVEGVWAVEVDPPKMGDSSPPNCLGSIAAAARATEARERKLENFIFTVFGLNLVECVDTVLFA